MSALEQLTPKVFVALGTPAARAASLIEPTKAACALFDLTTAERLAALLGQCAVETMRFTRFHESLHYTTLAVLTRTFKKVRALPVEEQTKYLRNSEKLANFVYADRYGNGDVESGDGYRYRGRGFIQTTFKANYENAAKLTGRPYVEQPELLEQPSDAALSACAYFVDRGCHLIADKGLTKANIQKITISINTAGLEAHLREELTLTAYGLLRF